VSAVVIAVLLALVLTGNLGTDANAGADGSSTSTTGIAADKVLARVGDDKITYGEFDRKLADFRAQYPDGIPDATISPAEYRQFELGVLDYLVTYRIVVREAAARKIEVTDDEAATEMEFIRSISFGGDQSRFESAVQEQGLTMERFEQIYRESLLFNKMFAEATKAVTVTEAEIQAHFEEHAGDTYTGKDLADVKDEIRDTLMDTKKQESWVKWLEKRQQAIGVTYSEGWTAPGAATTPRS
jgi:hypothetical protein